MAKVGRPSKYTPELAQEICDAVASSTLSMKELCSAHEHWPVYENIWRWRNNNLEFRKMYAQAKINQVDVSIDLYQELMNEPHKHIDEETGRTIVDVGMVRVKIEAIKWKAAKLRPREWADIKELETMGSDLADDARKRYIEQLDKNNRKDY